MIEWERKSREAEERERERERERKRERKHKWDVIAKVYKYHEGYIK